VHHHPDLLRLLHAAHHPDPALRVERHRALVRPAVRARLRAGRRGAQLPGVTR
jgi:hypothetical protein